MEANRKPKRGTEGQKAESKHHFVPKRNISAKGLPVGNLHESIYEGTGDGEKNSSF